MPDIRKSLRGTKRDSPNHLLPNSAVVESPTSPRANKHAVDSPRHALSKLIHASSPAAPLTDAPVDDLTNATSEPMYRTSVEMSGWVLKYQARIRTNQVRRYFRLNNSILSNHPQLTGPATWDASVSKCIVRTVDAKCLVIIRLPDKEIRFQLATEAEMYRWAAAIRSASVCNVEDFYRLGEQLGFGSFGAVRLGYDLATGAKRAVKIVERTSNAKELEFVQREINVLLSISHPNIVRTYDIFDERDKIYLVMEFVQGGDFFDYMIKRGKLQEAQAKHVMWQMLQGIDYLHANNIVHRDIKPENVLVVSTSPLTIQLTDFGFANFIDPASAAPATEMKSMVGTGCYMAPEVIDSRGHGKPVDIFATGVVMFRTLTGKLPFRGMTIQECYKQAMREQADFNSKEWKGISQEARTLCRSMLSADPAQRPSTTGAIQDEWFEFDDEFMSEVQRLDEKTVRKEQNSVQSFRIQAVLKTPKSGSADDSLFGEETKSLNFSPKSSKKSSPFAPKEVKSNNPSR